MITIKHSNRTIFIGLTVLLTGCSTNYNDYVYQKPHSRNLPEIPEIASVKVDPPAPRYTPPPIKPKIKTYKPKVHKYSPSKNSNTVITQKEVAAVKAEKEREKMQKWEEEVKQKAEVEIDPYANIPESNTTKSATTSKPTIVKSGSSSTSSNSPSLSTVKPSVAPPAERVSSPAVKTLLIKARADLVIGRFTSAIEKLERGLRIEPRNADLWYQLAKSHYAKKDYSQTVSMAKKSIQNTNRDYVIAKNWMLIKKAGLKSGDTVVVKEATDYFKINP